MYMKHLGSTSKKNQAYWNVVWNFLGQELVPGLAPHTKTVIFERLQESQKKNLDCKSCPYPSCVTLPLFYWNKRRVLQVFRLKKKHLENSWKLSPSLGNHIQKNQRKLIKAEIFVKSPNGSAETQLPPPKKNKNNMGFNKRRWHVKCQRWFITLAITSTLLFLWGLAFRGYLEDHSS